MQLLSFCNLFGPWLVALLKAIIQITLNVFLRTWPPQLITLFTRRKRNVNIIDQRAGPYIPSRLPRKEHSDLWAPSERQRLKPRLPPFALIKSESLVPRKPYKCVSSIGMRKSDAAAPDGPATDLRNYCNSLSVGVAVRTRYKEAWTWSTIERNAAFGRLII